jgi:hypothetical protein
MSNIRYIYDQTQAGRPLATVLDEVYPGADPKYWRVILAGYNPDAKPRRPRPSGAGVASRAGCSRKAAQAAAVARALTVLVERVNNRPEMTEAEMVEADRLWAAQHDEQPFVSGPDWDCGLQVPL